VEKQDRTERLFRWVVTHMPPRGIALLAGGLYFGLGLALPIALGASTLHLVSLNFAGTTLAGLLLLFWFIVQLEARDRRKLLEWTSDLRLLDSREFEFFVGEVLRREGWTVKERGRREGPDGNVDLEIRRGNERRVVQAKRWQSWLVGVDDIRAFAGTLVREGLPSSAGIFVTLSDFGEQARAEAKTIGLELEDGPELYTRAEKVRQPVICATCDGRMVLDRSFYGWWYRCVTPRCPGKIDLGADPVRALALLNEPR
jgi:restriction system protein